MVGKMVVVDGFWLLMAEGVRLSGCTTWEVGVC